MEAYLYELEKCCTQLIHTYTSFALVSTRKNTYLSNRRNLFFIFIVFILDVHCRGSRGRRLAASSTEEVWTTGWHREATVTTAWDMSVVAHELPTASSSEAPAAATAGDVTSVGHGRIKATSSEAP